MERINLTIATEISGKGGISSFLQVLKLSGFFNETCSRLIASHSSQNRIKLLLTFFRAILVLCYYGVFCNVGLVHLHMASRGSYTRKALILRLAHFFGAKTIIHLHGGGFKEFYDRECSEKKQRHIRDTFNLADKVIVLSTQWVAWVDTIIKGKNKICVVYNAVPEIHLPTRKSNKIVILFLGRLGKGKGVDDLITAFSQISDQFPNSELHLGGNGDLAIYVAQVKKLKLENKIKILGWVAGTAKRQCLADATIFCLPSYKEGFPMGILEAMAAEVAVIATTVGGIPDAIIHGKEGLLFEAGNVAALKEALIDILSNDNKRIALTKAAKIKYQQTYTPEVIVPQLIAIYQELLDDQK